MRAWSKLDIQYQPVHLGLKTPPDMKLCRLILVSIWLHAFTSSRAPFQQRCNALVGMHFIMWKEPEAEGLTYNSQMTDVHPLAWILRRMQRALNIDGRKSHLLAWIFCRMDRASTAMHAACRSVIRCPFMLQMSHKLGPNKSMICTPQVLVKASTSFCVDEETDKLSAVM